MKGFFDDKNLRISCFCASGVEKVLKSELFRLGLPEAPALNGELTFTGSALDVVRCNINLRTAERVCIKLLSFDANTFDVLFDNIYSYKWENVFGKDSSVTVNGKCVKSTLFSVSACQSIIKKAISKRLCEKYKVNTLSEEGDKFEIRFSVFKDNVSVYLNTSGAGLHKRGYRKLVGIAPIKETLASAILLLSDFYHKKPFADPFCGSGTFLTEGAMIALDIAPNKMRKFDFNYWTDFDKKYYETALEEAISKEKRDREIEFFGSDIDYKAIKLATLHAKNCGVYDKIHLEVKDVKDFSSSLKNGTIVTNPPYGERVIGVKEAKECYANLGKAYKKLDNWSAFVITSDNAFEKKFGIKSDKNRKLYNSEKECKLYYYYKKKVEND